MVTGGECGRAWEGVQVRHSASSHSARHCTHQASLIPLNFQHHSFLNTTQLHFTHQTYTDTSSTCPLNTCLYIFYMHPTNTIWETFYCCFNPPSTLNTNPLIPLRASLTFHIKAFWSLQHLNYKYKSLISTHASLSSLSHTNTFQTQEQAYTRYKKQELKGTNLEQWAAGETWWSGLTSLPSPYRGQSPEGVARVWKRIRRDWDAVGKGWGLSAACIAKTQTTEAKGIEHVRTQCLVQFKLANKLLIPIHSDACH